MDSRDTAVAPPTRRPSWTGALGAKLGRILSPYEEHVVEKDAFKSLPDDVSSIVSVGRGYRGVVAVGKKEDDDPVPPSSPDRRSVSRGREAFSSGRGGIGNIRRPSLDAASPPRTAGEGVFPVRGREATVDPERIAGKTGRGGVGNIRSGSQARNAAAIPENHPQTASLVSDHAASVAEYERNVIAEAEQSPRARSSGRGGLGNIKPDSKSRSHSRAPQIHSTGRGGAGNLQSGGNVDPEHLAQLEEEERLRYIRDQALHSTGRGGQYYCPP